MAKPLVQATGRRKESVARVRFADGSVQRDGMTADLQHAAGFAHAHLGALGDFFTVFAWDHHDTIVIGNHAVARPHVNATACDRLAHRGQFESTGHVTH